MQSLAWGGWSQDHPPFSFGKNYLLAQGVEDYKIVEIMSCWREHEVAKPSDKFKVGKWVRVMPSSPTEKQLLRVPYNKRVTHGGTEVIYENFAGGIYPVAEVCDGDFTVCLNIDGRRRWFDPDWLITVDDPVRLKEQDIRLKEGLRQMEAADRRRDEIFKQIFSPWWKNKEKKK